MDSTYRHPQNYKRGFLYLLLAAVALFGLARIYYRTTDDFRVGNMTYDLPDNPQWNIPLPTSEQQDELSHILQQPFSYLGKGAQIYAFLSKDGKYVLKFFKFKHLRPDWYLDWLPSLQPIESFRQAQISRRKIKLDSLFSGYKLAYDLDPENTGLLYIHLNPGKGTEPKVTVTDKIGITYSIDLQSVVFAVQKGAKRCA